MYGLIGFAWWTLTTFAPVFSTSAGGLNAWKKRVENCAFVSRGLNGVSSSRKLKDSGAPG